MNEIKLEELYAAPNGKVSDKWSSYIYEYSRILDCYRNKPINLLEIGVQNGGSLEIWSNYFSNFKKLIGCDINPECSKLHYDDKRISVIVGDANSLITKSLITSLSPNFEIIIDDGSHTSSDIVKSFANYFPLLTDGGIFIAEDLHCSYWQEFDGGLFDPFSSISFFKRLADVINHDHWGISKPRTSLLNGFRSKYGIELDEETLRHIHSVEFVNSICIIRKELPMRNALGIRIFSGQDELVAKEKITQEATSSSTPSQDSNKWTSRTSPPEEIILIVEEELSSLRILADTLEKELTLSKENTAKLESDLHIKNELNKYLIQSKNQILNSLSWKITKPLRAIKSQIKLLKRKAL